MKRFLLSMLAIGASAGLVLAPHAHALTISPARLELEAKPGASLDASFTVINEEQQSKTFYLSAQNFEAQGETGSPSFVDATEGLATWIEIPTQVTLAPREARTIDFKVRVPASAEPGGNFAGIFLGSVPPPRGNGENTQVTVGSKIGVLVLFRVLGDIREGGGLLEVNTQTHAHFFTALPIDFYYRFQNSGADRIEPQGTLTIKDTIGLTAAAISANQSQGNILPSSIRRFQLTWGTPLPANASTSRGFFGAANYQLHNFAFGRYVGHLALAYGTNGQHAEGKVAVYIFPWQLILIVVVLLLLVLFIGRFILRRYNRWIIAQAKSH